MVGSEEEVSILTHTACSIRTRICRITVICSRLVCLERCKAKTLHLDRTQHGEGHALSGWGSTKADKSDLKAGGPSIDGCAWPDLSYSWTTMADDLVPVGCGVFLKWCCIGKLKMNGCAL